MNTCSFLLPTLCHCDICVNKLTQLHERWSKWSTVLTDIRQIDSRLSAEGR
jgi:hypothetical protein